MERARDDEQAGRSGRPRVVINMASSLDGKINPAVRRGPFVMSRRAVDPARMLEIRARADAIVIGAGNLREDDPDLAITPADHARRGSAPLRVLVTTRGDGVRGDEAIFDPARGGATLVAHTAAMPDDARRRLGARAELAELGGTEVDVLRLLGWLGGDHGCRAVLVEGGGGINARFFGARAVDELFLTVVPRVLGGRGPTAVTGDGFGEDEIPDATLVSAEPIGDELFLHYAFAWPIKARSGAPPR